MKFEGDIREIDLIRTVLELAHGSFTGAARFEHDDLIKIIYLRDGAFLSASTNDRADTLDEILLRGSIASRDHIRQALARRKDGESLGDALLNLGFITRRELVKARRIQLIGILRSLAEWSDGTYQLVSDYVPKREEGTTFSVQQIVVELLVTSEDRSVAEAATAGGERVFAVAPGGAEIFAGLGMNEDAENVLSLVDGIRTASEIASATLLDGFSVYKLLHAFEVVGILESPDSVPVTAAAFDDELDWGPDPDAALGTSDEPSLLTGEDFDAGLDDGLGTPAPSAPLLDEPHEASPEPANVDAGLYDPYEPTVLEPTPAREEGASPFTRPQRSRRASRILPIALLLLVVLGGAAAAWWFLRPASSGGSTPAVADVEAVEDVVVAPDTAFAPEVPGPVAITETADDASPADTSTAMPSTTDAPAPVEPAAEGASPGAQVAWSWQVAFVCQESSLSAARAAGGSEVWTMPVVRDGRTCHRVFWGRFDSRDAARAARNGLPVYFRETSPILVSPRSMVR